MEDKTVSQVRELQGITRVTLQDLGSMTIRQGADESLTIRAEPDLLEKIRIEVKGDKLILGIGRDWLERLFSGLDFLRNRGVDFELSVKQLESLTVAGKYDLLIEALDVEELSVHSSGASTMKINDITASDLRIETSGRSEIVCSGRVDAQSIRCSGSSTYQAANLESQKCNVVITGHGQFDVWAEQSLDVSISGAGTVTYHGQPQVSQSISGIGEVKKTVQES